MALFVPLLKSLKLIEAAKAPSVIKTFPKALRPAAKFVYDLSHAKFSKHPPRGFGNGAQAVKTLLGLRSGVELITKLPDLFKALSREDRSQIALDLTEILGLKSCVQAVADGEAG